MICYQPKRKTDNESSGVKRVARKGRKNNGQEDEIRRLKFPLSQTQPTLHRTHINNNKPMRKRPLVFFKCYWGKLLFVVIVGNGVGVVVVVCASCVSCIKCVICLLVFQGHTKSCIFGWVCCVSIQFLQTVSSISLLFSPCIEYGAPIARSASSASRLPRVHPW